MSENTTDATKPCRNHPHHCPGCGREIECGYVCCATCTPPGPFDALIAAAREEGRREGEAERDVLQAQIDVGQKIRRYVAFVLTGDETGDVQLAADRAKSRLEAHAAQLVALRDIVDCACNALTDSIRASGNDARTNMHWVDMLRRKALVPLPDAEDALEKVKEEAVREFLAKEPSGRYRAIPQHCGVWWTFGDDVASEDVALTEAEARAVANALNALGAKGRE